MEQVEYQVDVEPQAQNVLPVQDGAWRQPLHKWGAAVGALTLTLTGCAVTFDQSAGPGSLAPGSDAPITQLPSGARATTVPYLDPRADHRYSMTKDTYSTTAVYKKYPHKVDLGTAMATSGQVTDLRSPACVQALKTDSRSDSTGQCWPDNFAGNAERSQGRDTSANATGYNIGGAPANSLGWNVVSWYSAANESDQILPRSAAGNFNRLTFITGSKTLNVSLMKANGSKLENDDIHAGGVMWASNKIGVLATYGMDEFDLNDLREVNGKYFLVRESRLHGHHAAISNEPFGSSGAIDRTNNTYSFIGYISNRNSKINTFRMSPDGKDFVAPGVHNVVPVTQTSVPLKRLQGVMTRGNVTFVNSSHEYNGNGMFFWKTGGPIYVQKQHTGVPESLSSDGRNIYSLTEHPVKSWSGPGGKGSIMYQLPLAPYLAKVNGTAT